MVGTKYLPDLRQDREGADGSNNQGHLVEYSYVWSAGFWRTRMFWVVGTLTLMLLSDEMLHYCHCSTRYGDGAGKIAQTACSGGGVDKYIFYFNLGTDT